MNVEQELIKVANNLKIAEDFSLLNARKDKIVKFLNKIKVKNIKTYDAEVDTDAQIDFEINSNKYEIQVGFDVISITDNKTKKIKEFDKNQKLFDYINELNNIKIAEEHVKTNIIFNKKRHFVKYCSEFQLKANDYGKEFYYPGMGWYKIYDVDEKSKTILCVGEYEPYHIYDFDTKEVINNLK